ncbi:MAG: VWA domain-containing protein [Bacteroidales bacterium]|nr:VWA domain-containing protein [Bacteroidales bacterium]
MGFESTYSFWWLPLAAILAVVLSFGIYRKNSFWNSDEKKWLYVAAVLRAISLFLITFLLIKPLIESNKGHFIKPKLMILQDASSSVSYNQDSNQFQSHFRDLANRLNEAFSKNNIDAEVYSFADSIKSGFDFSFGGRATNISNALSYASRNYPSDQIGGLLLISDGIYNKGNDPFYASKSLINTIYTLGVGDTSSLRDLSIDKVNIQTLVYSDQNIPFQMEIKANNANGQSIKYQFLVDKIPLKSGQVGVNKNEFFNTIIYSLPKLSVGIHRIDFELTPLENEKNTKNNFKTVYIEVVESKQKILMLASAPHPDIAAIKSVVLQNPAFEFELVYQSNFKNNFEAYNLVIVHGLQQNNKVGENILTNLAHAKVPVWVLMSPNDDVKQYDVLNDLLQWRTLIKKSDIAQASLNKNFNLFDFNNIQTEWLTQCPPLYAPSVKLNTQLPLDVLSFMKIKNIETDQPQWFFTQNNELKLCFTVGQGIWQWKMFNYHEDGNFNQFNRLITKTIQYLSLRQKTDRLRHNIEREYTSGQPINISLQYFDKSMSLNNTPEFFLKYTDEKNQSYEQIFSKTKEDYRLNLSRLKEGLYQYQIGSSDPSVDLMKTGFFVVSATSLENIKTRADFDLLRSISENTHGLFFEESKVDSLIDAIAKDAHFKAQKFNTTELSDWIQFKWYFWLLFVLIALEWWMRKYSGTI